MAHTFLATAAFGLEGVAANELKRMEIPARAENGGAAVFMTNRVKTEVLGWVDGLLLKEDPEGFETACGMYQMVATVLGDKLYGQENNPVRTMYFGALRDKVKAALR